MKIKQRPEDFVVTELDRYELSKTGPFCLYRLVKWDVGTIEALKNLSKNWNLARGQISFGGLKDRHARCEQVISIRGGPERSFEGSAFRLEYLGRSRDPITRKSFDENAFQIVIRDLAEIPDLEPVKRGGLPNYFDDQRFGSLRGTGGEFIGRALVRGEYERALRLAIASPSPRDRRRERELRVRLRDGWGNWAELERDLPKSSERSVVTYLARHPDAYGHAFELLDQDLRILLVSAYQSYLWNRTLAAILAKLPDTFEVAYAAGRHVFYRGISRENLDRLAELRLPLLTPAQRFEGEAGEIVARILEEEKIEARQFRLKKLRKTFFGKGLREAIIAPRITRHDADPDELNRGRKKLTLHFTFPRGSYATLLVKRLFHEPIPPESSGEEDAPDVS